MALEKIVSGNRYKIGIVKRDSDPDAPEFSKVIGVYTGSNFISSGIEYWKNFFEENPLQLDTRKTYTVYKVFSDGSTKYITEGNPHLPLQEKNGMSGIHAIGTYSQDRQESKIAIDALKAQIQQLNKINENLLEKIAEKDFAIRELIEKIAQTEVRLNDVQNKFDSYKLLRESLEAMDDKYIGKIDQLKDQVKEIESESKGGMNGLVELLPMALQFFSLMKNGNSANSSQSQNDNVSTISNSTEDQEPVFS